MSLSELRQQAHAAVNELLEVAKLRAGDILVIGCSTSEVMGQRIGSASNVEAAQALYQGITEAAVGHGVDVAFQCCEHLNRSLVVERRVQERYDLDEVSVIPVLHAGGAMATTAMANYTDPVVVESLNSRAKAGLDIGDTLIGMHIHPVVVPVRLQNKAIGNGHVHAARSRPKLIGGARAVYSAEQAKEANRG